MMRHSRASSEHWLAHTLHGVLGIDELRRRFAASPERLAEVVAGASEEALDRLPALREWSARTVLAHLRDDEFMVMRLRIERMLAEDGPTLAPFDEQAWERSRWRGDDNTDALLAGFRLHRAASADIVNRLTEVEWRRLGHQPEIGTFDLHWWVEHCLEHDEVHIAQVARALDHSH